MIICGFRIIICGTHGREVNPLSAKPLSPVKI